MHPWCGICRGAVRESDLCCMSFAGKKLLSLLLAKPVGRLANQRNLFEVLRYANSTMLQYRVHCPVLLQYFNVYCALFHSPMLRAGLSPACPVNPTACNTGSRGKCGTSSRVSTRLCRRKLSRHFSMILLYIQSSSRTPSFIDAAYKSHPGTYGCDWRKGSSYRHPFTNASSFLVLDVRFG